MTMKKKQMILYIFFFECVRVYNIYIYIFIFLYVYNLARTHMHTSMKRHAGSQKQALEKGQSRHTFFFLLRGKQKESKKIKTKYDSEQKKGEIN